MPSLRRWLKDGGYITNMTALPITGFQYGYLAESSKAKILFGPLQCQGQKQINENEMPCATLK